MKNKPFSYFDIIFGKDKTTGEGVEIAIDAVEEDNDEDEEFLDATENYHKEARKEEDKENREDIVALTCNAATITSKKN